MNHGVKEVFERLGAEGLVRVLGDLLDHRRIVRLANTCGLRYPGMRTQSQKRDRLLADLADRALTDEAARVTIGRTLQKETATERRRWDKLSDEEKARRIGDERFLRSNGNLGRHLYLLASAGGDGEKNGFQYLLAQQQLMRIAQNGSADRSADKRTREENRLHKRIAELQKKAQHLENQLAKSREAERTFKRDLIQRKGELAESRMLAERLGRELEQLRAERASSTKSAAGAPAADTVSKVNKALRKLTSEQAKFLRTLQKGTQEAKSAEPRKRDPLRIDPSVLEPLRQDLGALRKELAAQRRDFKRESQRQGERIEELRAVGLGTVWRARAAGEAERVGVFIDVQNMYYGARRLKGKLDFDALLKAAVGDRRLIRATAYVVESKEIDQSGFIALLEQRAIEVRRKTLQVRADHSKKGDWDMELALDVLDAAPRLDVVVLVSGDGDFTSLVKRVKSIGPRVEVIGFPRTTAKSLLQAADHFEPLGRKLMIYPPRKNAKRTTRNDSAPSESE